MATSSPFMDDYSSENYSSDDSLDVADDFLLIPAKAEDQPINDHENQQPDVLADEAEVRIEGYAEAVEDSDAENSFDAREMFIVEEVVVNDVELGAPHEADKVKVEEATLESGVLTEFAEAAIEEYAGLLETDNLFTQELATLVEEDEAVIEESSDETNESSDETDDEFSDESDESSDESDESSDESGESSDESDESSDESDEASDERDEASDESDEASDESDEASNESDKSSDEIDVPEPAVEESESVIDEPSHDIVVPELAVEGGQAMINFNEPSLETYRFIEEHHSADGIEGGSVAPELEEEVSTLFYDLSYLSDSSTEDFYSTDGIEAIEEFYGIDGVDSTWTPVGEGAVMIDEPSDEMDSSVTPQSSFEEREVTIDEPSHEMDAPQPAIVEGEAMVDDPSDRIDGSTDVSELKRFARGIFLQDEFSYEINDYLSELERMAAEQYSSDDDEIDSSIHDFYPERFGDGIEVSEYSSDIDMISDEMDGYLFDFSSNDDEIDSSTDDYLAELERYADGNEEELYPDGDLPSDEIDDFGEDYIVEIASLEDGVEEEYSSYGDVLMRRVLMENHISELLGSIGFSRDYLYPSRGYSEDYLYPSGGYSGDCLYPSRGHIAGPMHLGGYIRPHADHIVEPLHSGGYFYPSGGYSAEPLHSMGFLYPSGGCIAGPLHSGGYLHPSSDYLHPIGGMAFGGLPC